MSTHAHAYAQTQTQTPEEPAASSPEPAPRPVAAASAARTWEEILRPYKRADWRRAALQLGSNLVLYFGLWTLMLKSLEVGYWLTLLLALPAAGMLIRLFIIQHDCGHGAYFQSKRVNDVVGFFIGVLMLTPYQYWRRTHAIHHATSGDLDRREFGDIITITVAEYRSRSWWGRLTYRLYRNPITLFMVGPVWQFIVKHRLPFDIPLKGWKREWASVLWTNLAIAAVVIPVGLTLGWQRFLLVQAPITLISASIGIWLFYVQHQFEDTYWRHTPEWDYYRAGLEGSSFYDLHPVLHWLTGNIGYHHIHHLSSRIPNYFLPRCMKENPELHQVTHIKLWESFKCARLKLWDETSGQLVGFDHPA